LGHVLNPKQRSFTDDEWGILSFVMNDHHDRIRELIVHNGLFEAQLAARKDAVQKGKYEAVPGLTFGTIEECDSRPDEMLSIRSSHVDNGWALYLTIAKGEYPDLDRKLGDLQNAVELRNRQLADYIASF
jgi:hypothetical protein